MSKSKKTKQARKSGLGQADLLMIRSMAKGIEALGRELAAWCDRKLQAVRLG